MDCTVSVPFHDTSREESVGGTVRNPGTQKYLFELEFDNGPSDDHSMLSAISTPIGLHDDASTFQYEKQKLDSLGLYGRDADMETLLKAFDGLSSSTSLTGEGTARPGQRQLVLISGTSGAGKTTLAEILKAPATEQGGLFVRGKFAKNMINQPYSGIANACAELCGAILDFRVHSPEKYIMVGEQITSALDTELGLLVQVIPALEEIVDVPVQWSTMFSTTGRSPSNDSKSQILFAFRRFLQVAVRVFSPLVMTLDDLQCRHFFVRFIGIDPGRSTDLEDDGDWNLPIERSWFESPT
jgi:AAA ATPase domain